MKGTKPTQQSLQLLVFKVPSFDLWHEYMRNTVVYYRVVMENEKGLKSTDKIIIEMEKFKKSNSKLN